MDYIVHGIWNRPLFLPPKRILLTWWGLEKNNHFAGRPHCTWFEYCWWNHLRNVLVEHNDPAWLIFRWGWMGQLILGCWFIPLSYSTILAQVRTRRPEHLKHKEIQILLIRVLLSFHDLLDDVPKKTSVATSAQELDQEGNDLWANFVEWCAFLGTKLGMNLTSLPSRLPAGNGCYQKNE